MESQPLLGSRRGRRAWFDAHTRHRQTCGSIVTTVLTAAAGQHHRPSPNEGREWQSCGWEGVKGGGSDAHLLSGGAEASDV